MPNLTLVKKIPCTPSHAFNVVSDIASYPLFVPSCVSTRFLEAIPSTFSHKSLTLSAEMSIQFGPIYETYISKVHFEPIKSIKITAQSGERSIFTHLNTLWEFSPVVGNQDACNIEFRLDFQFCSPFYNTFSALFMHQLSVHTMQSFEDRMIKLYKKPREAIYN